MGLDILRALCDGGVVERDDAIGRWDGLEAVVAGVDGVMGVTLSAAATAIVAAQPLNPYKRLEFEPLTTERKNAARA